MTRLLVPAAALLMLSACGSPQQNTPVATNTIAAPEDDYVAKVRALPKRQQQGVFLRAIRDDGRDCQDVTAAQEVGTIDSAPTWAVTCDKQTRWLVAIKADGIATVIAPSELPPTQPKG
jgi:hypothetical protein